jgi:peptide/nickel transport system substrate-binding protein
MTAADVAYTFGLLKRFPALDGGGLWGFLASVSAPSATTVELRLSRVYVPSLALIASVPVVPEHVWSKVADPVTFTNPDPVATGPFTVVRSFSNQMYELGRNPNYWQAGKPKVEALRFLAYPSNDQANLALVEGSVDWAGNFVPAIDRTFVSRDPAHNGYWFPLMGSTVFLYANTTRKPFDDVRVRRALSLSIDRAKVADLAMYGTTVPSDPTGLSDGYGSWRTELGPAENWTRFDVAEANRLLDEAGLARGADGMRRDATGAPLTFEIGVVAGWSDWVRAAQLIARGLKEVGVEAKVRPSEFSAWFSSLQRGEFDLAVSWSTDGPTPYAFYRWLMAPATVLPVGEVSPGNWHRFGDDEAGRLLEQFEQTADEAQQRSIVEGLQHRFAATLPAIPLFPGPQWAAFTTRRFTGFPTKENPYASPSPNAGGASLLVLTELQPVEAP